jgi:hypothetical protein
MVDESNIQDYSGVKTPIYIPEQMPTIHPTEAKETDTSTSTIEPSKAKAPQHILGMNAPLLIVPEDKGELESSGNLIALLGGVTFGEININIWKQFEENLRQIQEQVAALVNSPAYQALLSIKLHGDSASVTGVQSARSANAAEANPLIGGSFDIVSAVEQLKNTWSKVSPTGKSSESDLSNVVIPMTAVVFMGGAMAIAGMEMSVSASGMSSNPIQGSLEIIGHLQPSLPVLGMQDVIPMINLMVMAPIYYNALTEATSRLSNNERQSQVLASQKYAQDIIRMASNPDYIMVNFVNKMTGAEQMSLEKKQEIANVMRLILSTVALSLLYSVETGKVQGEQFWGMEPQELRDILNGTIPGPDPTKQLTQQERLTSTLINMVQSQLSALSSAQRLASINAILNFVSTNHSIEKMLDPHKVLHEVFSSMDYDAEEVKAVDKQPI